MSLFAEAQPSPTAPRRLDRSDSGLLPKDGSEGAPRIAKAGLGRAKIACHVNSVDVLVERLWQPRAVDFVTRARAVDHDIKYFNVHLSYG